MVLAQSQEIQHSLTQVYYRETMAYDMREENKRYVPTQRAMTMQKPSL